MGEGNIPLSLKCQFKKKNVEGQGGGNLELYTLLASPGNLGVAFIGEENIPPVDSESSESKSSAMLLAVSLIFVFPLSSENKN